MKGIIGFLSILLFTMPAYANGAPKEPRQYSDPKTLRDEPPHPCKGKVYCNLQCRKIVHPNYEGGVWAVQILPCPTCKRPITIVTVPEGHTFTGVCAKPGHVACVDYTSDEGRPRHRMWFFGPAYGPDVALQSGRDQVRMSTFRVIKPHADERAVPRRHRHSAGNQPERERRNYGAPKAWFRK